MRSARVFSFALALAISSLVFHQDSYAADNVKDVKMDGASFQEIVDKLLGTSDTEGLLDRNTQVNLHAKDVTLTEAQVTDGFADLITAAGAARANLKIEGALLDGGDFKLNLSGKQVKLEGLVLTQAEFDALVAELKQIDGLKEAKIQATVDGRLLIAKLQNEPGRVKIEDKGLVRSGKPDTADRKGPNRGSDSARSQGANQGSGRGDRPEKIEKIERVSKGERPDRPEKIERIERSGPGRR